MALEKIPRFVTVTNISGDYISIYPNWPKTDKGRPIAPLEMRIGPKKSSPPLPYGILEGSKNWNELVSGNIVNVRDMDFVPCVVSLENKSSEDVEVELMVTKKTSDKDLSKGVAPERNKVGFRVPPKATSNPFPYNGLVDKSRYAERGDVILKPHRYIGPTWKRPETGCIGSLGGDDVYACWECGEPIVFRYNPPHPIHV